MIKILVLEADRLNGVTWWRCYKPFSELRKQHRDLDFEFKSKVTVQDLMLYDLIITYRPTQTAQLDFLRAAKQFGVPVIIDCDDDLSNLPPSHPMALDYNSVRHIFAESLSLASYVWVSTEQLLYSCDALGKGEVMQNAITSDMLPDAPAPWKGIFAWRGNENHMADLLNHRKWYERNTTAAQEWRWIGYFPPFRHGTNARPLPYNGNVCGFIAALPYSGTNVTWKPLEDNAFNAAKSNIAWIEATMSGGVCVTNFAGREQWGNALKDFPTDPELVAMTWERSRADIVENYNLHEVNERRYLSIKTLVGD